MLVYQHEQGAMTALMRGVMTSYSRHYNTKYKRRGPLFESRYKASIITTESYLLHISRYIHLNPKDWLNHPYSSLPFYLGVQVPEWIQIDKITSLFKNTDYLEFMKDYEDHKAMLDEIKYDLADKIILHNNNSL
jgi:putative transposase